MVTEYAIPLAWIAACALVALVVVVWPDREQGG